MGALNNSLSKRQVVLFPATMPSEDPQLSRNYLKDPAEVTIRQKGAESEHHSSAPSISMEIQKLEALHPVFFEAESSGRGDHLCSHKAITLRSLKPLNSMATTWPSSMETLPQNQRRAHRREGAQRSG